MRPFVFEVFLTVNGNSFHRAKEEAECKLESIEFYANPNIEKIGGIELI